MDELEYQLVDVIVRWLEQQGFGTVGTNLFVDMLPDSPDEASVVWIENDKRDKNLAFHSCDLSVLKRGKRAAYGNTANKLREIEIAIDDKLQHKDLGAKYHIYDNDRCSECILHSEDDDGRPYYFTTVTLRYRAIY